VSPQRHEVSQQAAHAHKYSASPVRARPDHRMRRQVRSTIVGGGRRCTVVVINFDVGAMTRAVGTGLAFGHRDVVPVLHVPVVRHVACRPPPPLFSCANTSRMSTRLQPQFYVRKATTALLGGAVRVGATPGVRLIDGRSGLSGEEQ
jgi:hypothetical protein